MAHAGKIAFHIEIVVIASRNVNGRLAAIAART